MSGGTAHISIQNSQAEVYCCKTEYAEARDIQIHILHTSSSNAAQGQYEHAVALLNIAQIDIEIGASAHDVRCNLEGAHILFQKMDYSFGLVWCDTFRAALDLQQGNYSAARSLFQKCLSLAWGMEAEIVSYCLERLGAAQLWGPVDLVSFSWTVSFFVNSCKFKQKLELHKALQFLGDIFQAQGDQDTAVSLFTVALDGFTQLDVHCSRAECMVRLGDISNQNGDPLKAAKLWETARPLFERSSQRKQLDYLNIKLVSLSQNQSQGVQQGTLDCRSTIHAPTEKLKQSSDAESPDSTWVGEIENMGLQDKEAVFPVPS
jgi:tetratricopeptide (TPR) repeat protein